MLSPPQPQRVEFANDLRGLAALCVVVSHYVGMFWVAPLTIFDLAGLPPLAARPPAFGGWMFALEPAFNWGAFGVGVFFLISGFVIPFSLRRHVPAGFLLARAIRILPVYAAGFALGVAVLLAYLSAIGAPFPHRWQDVAVHLVAGLRLLLPAPTIDGVVWTLEIEFEFYALCALAAPWLVGGRRRVFAVPLAVGVAAVILGEAARQLGPGLPQLLLAKGASRLAMAAPYLAVMFAGTAFHYLYRDRISALAAFGLVVVLAAAFVLLWPRQPVPQPALIELNYLWALLVFAGAYALRRRWTRGIAPLRFLAAVSYPLYVVHPLVGYAAMHALARAGVPAPAATLIAIVLALGLAYGLHRAVEKPTQAMAHRVGGRRPAISAA